MKIQALVVFPIWVELEISEGTTKDEVENRLLDQAERILETTTIKAVIHECTPDLDSFPDENCQGDKKTN